MPKVKSYHSIEKRPVPQVAAYLPAAKSRNTFSKTMSRLKTLQQTRYEGLEASRYVLNRTIIDGTTRDGAESSNRQQSSVAGRLPLLGSDRPGEYTPEGSSARYRQADRALNAAYSLPKRTASKAMIT